LTGPCFFQVVFRGGSDLAGTLQPEKKGPVENHSQPDDCMFFFSGRNLEAAKIWRERYDQKKKLTVVWPAMFFGELHLY
jgi:hypothetical protein